MPCSLTQTSLWMSESNFCTITGTCSSCTASHAWPSESLNNSCERTDSGRAGALQRGQQTKPSHYVGAWVRLWGWSCCLFCCSCTASCWLWSDVDNLFINGQTQFAGMISPVRQAEISSVNSSEGQHIMLAFIQASIVRIQLKMFCSNQDMRSLSNFF